LDDRRRDGGTNSTLRTEEQGTHLTLNEHDDDNDDDDVYMCVCVRVCARVRACARAYEHGVDRTIVDYTLITNLMH